MTNYYRGGDTTDMRIIDSYNKTFNTIHNTTNNTNNYKANVRLSDFLNNYTTNNIILLFCLMKLLGGVLS